MSGRGRFAPSPTGALHFGSLVSAMASALWARGQGHEWLIRIEDVDQAREAPGSAASILSTLRALGLEGPLLPRQSTRSTRYAEAVDALVAAGQAFCCGCSRSDLPASGIYPGTCRRGLPPGREPRSVRCRVDRTVIEFEDRIQGVRRQDLAAEVGDFVIRRADGFHAYHLAVVLDDADQGITEVVRGADLLDSTPRQILLQRLLGLPTPVYAHHPVAVDTAGRKLSKQAAALPVRTAEPLPALLAAWRFLGQRPLDPVPQDVAGFWREALEAWDRRSVPRRREAPLPDAPGGGRPR